MGTQGFFNGCHAGSHEPHMNEQTTADTLYRRYPMKLSGGLVAWLAYAATMLGVAFIGADWTRNDFHSFYLSGITAQTGQVFHIPDRPDLNPPIFGWVMVPFTWVPPGIGFALWTALGCVALVASLRIIRSRTSLSATGWLWVVGGLGATTPALIVWQEGQLVWFLLYFVTRAWAASSDVRAGLWLVPVVMIKPPLALMVLLLPWRTWLTTGFVAGLGTLAAVAVMGPEPWLAWMAKSRAVTWLDWPLSASLWSVVARMLSGSVRGGTTIHDLPTSAVEIILYALVVIGAKSYFQAEGDRSWIVGITFASLASPLGWVYYLPVVLGPLVRSWNRSYAISTGLLTVPLAVIGAMGRDSFWGAVLLGSVYFMAVIVAWAASLSLYRPSHIPATVPQAAPEA